MKNCENDHIIKLYEFIETKNSFYLVMEYCNGGDLEKLIKKNKQLSEKDSVNFLKQLLKGFRNNKNI